MLVVEDCPDLRATLCDLVTSWGHHAVGVASGERGLDELLRGRPDVALIDIGLPDIDGCTVVRRARELGHRGTRLVAVTGYMQPTDRARMARAGFDDLVGKPPELERLRQLIDSAPEWAD